MRPIDPDFARRLQKFDPDTARRLQKIATALQQIEGHWDAMADSVNNLRKFKVAEEGGYASLSELLQQEGNLTEDEAAELIERADRKRLGNLFGK